MADLKINPAEVQAALANFVKSYDPGVAARDEVGTVSQAGDGIARVEGLPSTMANELLQFENEHSVLHSTSTSVKSVLLSWVVTKELKKEHQYVVLVKFSLFQLVMASWVALLIHLVAQLMAKVKSNLTLAAH
jgi:F0F1-type ATP synthase alpha subunit